MKLTLAKSAGFCYGVRRAVELADSTAKAGTPCVILGSIVHNMDVVRHLAQQGLRSVDCVDDVPGDGSVIIRSHGEGRAVYEQLREKGAQILDATCPSVKRIHELVLHAEEEGRQPVIIGTPDHPEVLAIAGWCCHPVVLENARALSEWLDEAENRRELPLTFVSQTTSTRKIWDECAEIAKKECTNANFFDTICGATSKRQEEAQRLAAESDAMVVIGDRKSSNTKRLAELCRELCSNVQLIERAEDLDMTCLRDLSNVGITAGASTPEWIIKEVYDKMSEEIMEIEKSFAELLEESIKTLNTGDKVTGTVVAITPTEIQVELGIKYPGYIPVDEFSDDPSIKIEEHVKVGDEIESYVMLVSDRDCMVKLSKKRLDMVKGWDEVEAAVEAKTVMEGIVTEENKGGVVVSVKGVRVFVPASQTGLPKDADMSTLIKQQVKLRITEVNRARRRVVGSIRAVTAEERRAKAEAIWNTIEVGNEYDGVVKSLTTYGAFVDIGGVDGMVHISELSWGRVRHPSEIVKVGDAVKVFVIGVDKEKKKISLGYRRAEDNPWTKFISQFQVGDTASVKVLKFMPFGAFAEVIPGVDGLIHISQIATTHVKKADDVLTEGEVVDAKIVDIDMDRQKVSLSIRALLEGEETDAE